MNTLKNVKLFGLKLKVSSFLKKILSFFLAFSIVLFPLTVSSFALDGADLIPYPITNPIAAFPEAYYQFFTRGNVQDRSFFEYERNILNTNSARFFGEFQSKSAFQNWIASYKNTSTSNPQGIFKVMLRGDAPSSRLFKGDVISLKCRIRVEWKVGAGQLGNGELWSPDLQFGFLPVYARSYFSGYSALTGEAKAYPLTDNINGTSGNTNVWFNRVDTALYPGDVLQEEVLANPDAYPDIGDLTSSGFGKMFPYKSYNPVYCTEFLCDVSCTLPEDIILDSQPLNIVFETEAISGAGKYELVNFIQFDFYEFEYVISTSMANAQLAQLMLINKNLNDIFYHPYSKPSGEKIPNVTIDSVEGYEKYFKDSASSSFDDFRPRFDSALSLINGDDKVILSIRALSSFVNGLIVSTPLSKFFVIVLPISVLTVLLSISMTAYTRSKNEERQSIKADQIKAEKIKKQYNQNKKKQYNRNKKRRR